MPKQLKSEEDHILRSMGVRGYLKVPDAFWKERPYDKNALPSPVAYEDKRRGKIRLIFEWDEKDFEAAKREE